MPYLYATEDIDYSDLSSGRVLYNLPGAPAFPVRLSSEIFQRGLARLGLQRKVSLYDPVCGGAYHLCVLGFLHGGSIEAILASDVSGEALALAQRNLGLLSPQGLQQRKMEIKRMLEQYGKESHAAGLQSIEVLEAQLQQQTAGQVIRTRVFQANALDSTLLRQELNGERIDLVISDIPYGLMSSWMLPDPAQAGAQSSLWRMLDALLPQLSAQSLVAIAADKQQKIVHEGYLRVERFQIGKRQVAFLKPIN